MPKEKVPLQQLQDYLPHNCYDGIYTYLQQHKIQLTITQKRQSVLGDYRYAYDGKGHRISVNGNLNKFSFLITLLHEIAHLLTFEKYGAKIAPHGKEWKQMYSGILAEFVARKIFPEDIENALMHTLKSPAAGTCGDPTLMRVLKKYDPVMAGHCLVEQLEEGSSFHISDNKQFIRGPKIRTRYKCKEVSTGKWYLFNGLHEVRKEG